MARHICPVLIEHQPCGKPGTVLDAKRTLESQQNGGLPVYICEVCFRRFYPTIANPHVQPQLIPADAEARP